MKKALIFTGGLAIIALALFLAAFSHGIIRLGLADSWWQFPSMLCMFSGVLFLLITLWQWLRGGAAKRVRFCSLSGAVLYAAGLPLLYMAADLDDAPGVILIGLLIVLAALVSAILAGKK